MHKWDFAILYFSSRFVQNHLPSVFHMHFLVCSSLLCIPESPSVSPLWCFITQNSESACSRFQKPVVSTAWISGDCNQTWPRSGTSGWAGFDIFKRLWQTRGLENKVQLWPILSCVIRAFLYPKFCH